MKPCRDIGAVVTERFRGIGADARVAVLPQGPLTIPYLAYSLFNPSRTWSAAVGLCSLRLLLFDSSIFSQAGILLTKKQGSRAIDR
jgi:hypothetical protein